MKKIIAIFSWIVLATALIILIYLGTLNKVDPYWQSLDTLLAREDIYYLDDKPEVLDSIFRSYQKDTSLYSISSIKLISNPFLPTMDIQKFEDFVDYFHRNHIIIVSGVSGAGKTTIMEIASNFIAASPDRIVRVQCVEKMDVELHKEWIGYRNEKGFFPGKLLKFFDRCWDDPEHNYIFIIDDIDKIYPATFFGAALWNELDEPKYVNSIEGYSNDLQIPPNFFMVAATHSGVGSTIKLNFEHYRRLGNNVPYMICPDPTEFLMYIRTKYEDRKIPQEDKAHIKKMLYFFHKANKYIEENYGLSYKVGQWTSVRKYLKPEQFNDFVNVFIENVNTYAPEIPLSEEDFKPIYYTIEKNGLIKNSNAVYMLFQGIIETGIFSEVTVAILFALLTGIFSWSVYRKKRKFITTLISKSGKTVNDFESNLIDYDESRGQLLLVQENIDQYLIKRKINFTEANYLLTTLRQQLSKIDDINKLKQVSVDLGKMFSNFTADGKLDKKEYDQLIIFLEGIKSTIPEKVYFNLKNQIDDSFRKSSVLFK